VEQNENTTKNEGLFIHVITYICLLTKKKVNMQKRKKRLLLLLLLFS